VLKRISKNNRKDVSYLAHHLLELSTQDTLTARTKNQISALMAHMGKKGGKIGGKRRLETMSAKERSRIAKKAAEARWRHA
jgi:hypothetical protein